jgi:hypothetical protein
MVTSERRLDALMRRTIAFLYYCRLTTYHSLLAVMKQAEAVFGAGAGGFAAGAAPLRAAIAEAGTREEGV